MVATEEIITNIYLKQEISQDTSACRGDSGEDSDKVEDNSIGEDSISVGASVYIEDSVEVSDDRLVLTIVVGNAVNSVVIGWQD